MSLPAPAGPVAAREWVEVIVRVPPADAELVADVLHQLSPGGVAIEPVLRRAPRDDLRYELPDEAGVVRAALPSPFPAARRRWLRRRLAALPLSAPPPPLRYRTLHDEDWAGAYRQHFQTLHIGERLVVRPPWEPYAARPHELVIDLDPGHAFGTGQHESTQLALVALEQHLPAAAAVLDLGTGSGILAIAAAKLGAASVRALDVDPDAVQAARENVRRNALGDAIEVAIGSLAAQWPGDGHGGWGAPQRCADLLLVNITWKLIVDVMPELVAALRPGGVLIGSGFSARTAGAVAQAMTTAGLRLLETYEQASEEVEWRCIAARLPAAVAAPAGR